MDTAYSVLSLGDIDVKAGGGYRRVSCFEQRKNNN